MLHCVYMFLIFCIILYPPPPTIVSKLFMNIHQSVN